MMRTLVLLTGAGGLAATLYSVGLQPGFGAAPWLVFAGCYVGFRSQSYISLSQGLENFAKGLRYGIGVSHFHRDGAGHGRCGRPVSR